MNKQEFINKYYVDRKGTHSMKWDQLKENFDSADLLPLWIADMDFKVSEGINEAILDRVQHGVYGYSEIPDSYYTAYFAWMKQYYNYTLEREWIRFSHGVVQAMYNLINAFTQEDEAVIIQTPVYYPFHDAVKNTQRQLITVDLVRDNTTYTFDYKAFEKAVVDNSVKMYIHCSPHNPIGRVWTEDELIPLFDICQKHDVLIVSDEIHQDFTFSEYKHVPSAVVANGSYADQVITTNSTSKSFNLAGLTHSHVIISNSDLRQKYDAYMTTITNHTTNILSVVATEAAYSEGKHWLDSIKRIVYDNYLYMKETLEIEVPEVTLFPLEGTYLVFIDFNPILKGMSLKTFLQDRCRLAVDYGEWFGEGYEGYARLNLATKPAHIEETTQRIVNEAKKLYYLKG